MKTILLITFLLLGSTAMAFEKEDTGFELQQAMMDANQDYNISKKQVLNEENERIATWNQRQVREVVIIEGIQVEARDYRTP